jgi:hypothetical protein
MLLRTRRRSIGVKPASPISERPDQAALRLDRQPRGRRYRLSNRQLRERAALIFGYEHLVDDVPMRTILPLIACSASA